MKLQADWHIVPVKELDCFWENKYYAHPDVIFIQQERIQAETSESKWGCLEIIEKSCLAEFVSEVLTARSWMPKCSMKSTGDEQLLRTFLEKWYLSLEKLDILETQAPIVSNIRIR